MPTKTSRIDPTKTTRLRRAFMAEIKRRFLQLAKDIELVLVQLDALGLELATVNVANSAVPKQAWRFLTDDQKINAFNKWFQKQVDARLFSTVGKTAKSWTAEYVDSAYKQGLLNAWMKARKVVPSKDKTDFTKQTQTQFLRTVFSQPEKLSKARLLGTRVLEELSGIGKNVATRMSRVLADGILRGDNPKTIARAMRDQIGTLTRTRALAIARTEIIHAHAEGQLDSFQDLGIEEVGVEAEWSTAGDDKVCPLCEELEGVVMSIDRARGLLPRHTNCRCSWVPALKSVKEKGQIRGSQRVDAAIKRSLRAEKKDLATAQLTSTWAGKETL